MNLANVPPPSGLPVRKPLREPSRFLSIFASTPLHQAKVCDSNGQPQPHFYPSDPESLPLDSQSLLSTPPSSQWLRRVVAGALFLLTAAGAGSFPLGATAADRDASTSTDALSTWLQTAPNLRSSSTLSISALNAAGPAHGSTALSQDEVAAREHVAYQGLIEHYSPWLRLASSMTLREHRQNARASSQEDAQLHRLQALQSIRAQAFAEQMDQLHARNPNQFAALSSRLALRQVRWRQLSSAQIDASLDERERAELQAQNQIQALSDSSTAFFGDGFASCVASISASSLSENDSVDHSLFSHLDLDVQRAFAAGHELGHCETPINLDPANAGHFQALWAKLAATEALGETLSASGTNARLSFSSLLNEASADAYGAMLSHLALGSRVLLALPSIVHAREVGAQSETLEDAESHRTAAALRWIQDAMNRSGGRGPSTPDEMDVWALNATRAAAQDWLAHYGAPSEATHQLIQQALGPASVQQAREQALERLANDTHSSGTPSIAFEEEPSAWSSPQNKAQALTQLRLRLDEARTGTSLTASVASSTSQLASMPRRHRP